MDERNQDQAGQEYWDQAWNINSLPKVWPVDSSAIRHHVERSMFTFLTETLSNYGPRQADRTIVEVGCARSAVLPLFDQKLGFHVAGVDYSPVGCQQAREILKREGVRGEIYCCDVFSVPDELREKFDVVVSFGLIEHFSDTSRIVGALASLVKPGGLVISNVPNMCGAIGSLQKGLDRAVYDIHVPLDQERVRLAHEQAGLNVLSCEYFLANNFGVVNINSARPLSLQWWLKKPVLSLFARFSIVVWWWERTFGRLPVSRRFSPYINCVATKANEIP